MHDLDPAALRRHITFKRDGERSLAPAIAEHMLSALDAGAPADYQQLLRAAQWPDPPAEAFHTAPRHARQQISATGLRAGQPGADDTDAWADTTGIYATQPVGVYVAEAADLTGRWTRWAEWDVWQVRTTGLPWRPDDLNPRCWVLTCDVPAERLSLVDRIPR